MVAALTIHECRNAAVRAKVAVGVVFSLVLSATMATAAPIAAEAALNPCQGQKFIFDGFYIDDSTPQSSIEGVSSSIVVRSGALCPTRSDASNLSAAWVMVLENEGHALLRGVAGGLAQVGILETPSRPNPNYFFEGAQDDAGLPIFWHNGVPTGASHRFWVQWVSDASAPCTSSGGCFSYNVDVTRIGLSDFNPYPWWGYPNNSGQQWDIQLLGETHDQASDIMGNSTGSATVFSNEQAQDYITNNYRNFDCSLASEVGSTRYGLNYPSSLGCGAWSIYTK